jgi:chromosome partitioning protein
MKTIAIAAAKGGVGKSTLTAALSTAAGLAGAGRVGIIDLDPQGSLTRWWNDRSSPTPILYQKNDNALRAAKLQAIKDNVSTLFMDCPPSFSAIQEDAIGIADLVLIPVQPSALDLDAVASTVAMAERLRVRFRLVLNRAIYRSRIAGQAVEILRATGKIVYPPIHQRVAIAEAMSAGLTALETDPSGRAASELSALWESVQAVLARPIPLTEFFERSA